MRTLQDLEPQDQTILLQAALDVPLKEGEITDDTRLRASLPTIRRLLDAGCKVIIAGHIGRPQGNDPALSTKVVAERYSQLLDRPVAHIPEVKGEKAKEAIKAIPKPGVAVLENIRYDPGEEAADEEFARSIASLADAFINDDYPDAHRGYALNTVVPRLLPSAAGPALLSEYQTVKRAVDNPEKPMVLIVGGAKADKIGAINNLLGVADTIIIGGVLANTFLKAQGRDVKGSKVDERSLEIAGEFLRDAEEKFLLPVDVVAAAEFSEASESKELPLEELPEGWQILDVGTHTQERYAQAIADAKTVVWGGPIGVFEWKQFRRGTEAVANALAKSEAFSLVAGGDSGEAVRMLGLEDRMSHISIGGGVTLKLIAGEKLPAIEALRD